MTTLSLQDFPQQTYDKVRYADTDRQGHVNNAVFSTFLETGRTAFIFHPEHPILAAGASFVIASLHLDFIKEITWPGRVDIGTGVIRIGNSSLTLLQQLFQHGQCVARAETVIVQVDDASGRSKPLGEGAKQTLTTWMLHKKA